MKQTRFWRIIHQLNKQWQSEKLAAVKEMMNRMPKRLVKMEWPKRG
jgi:hypothetical protein